MKKKSKKYMSEENFNLLVESLNQAIEYERGERDDLRVTVVPAPPRAEAETAMAGKALRSLVTRELEGLNEAKLRQIAEFIAFLKFQERISEIPINGDVEIEKEIALDQLLAGINEHNLHPEFDMGPPVGKEAW